MAIQGLVTYYYNFVNKDNAVEPNQYHQNNMMWMDVLCYHRRNEPNERTAAGTLSILVKKQELFGRYRNTLKYCEDRSLLLGILDCDSHNMHWFRMSSCLRIFCNCFNVTIRRHHFFVISSKNHEHFCLNTSFQYKIFSSSSLSEVPTGSK
jgi:hypothetical protein